jgi:hypothetical protein
LARSTTITVVDADLVPIAGARVALLKGSLLGATDEKGVLMLPAASGRPLQLTIAQQGFVTENVAFGPDLESGVWDNSLVRRRVGPNSVDLKVVLGRCAAAPTTVVTDSDLGKLSAGQTSDPGAALLFHPPRFPDVFAYRGHWLDPLRIRVANEELLPVAAAALTQKGWDRFNTQISDPLQIAERGRFFWLVYPESRKAGEQQYVVAVWSPNLDADQPLQALDMVVFFSPHTAAYVGNYPFGVVGAKGAPPVQPYIELGRKYLLDEYGFVYDLIARGIAATVVMPICRHGDWGPFASGVGMSRLLNEVAVFLHRECRTSNLGVKQTAYDPAYRFAGASLRTSKVGIRATDFGDVPSLGKVAVGFFSTGALAAKQLMSSGGPRMWSSAWKELWDLDGFHPATGGWPNYLSLVSQWVSDDPARVLRLWHSSGRVPPDPLTDPAPLWKQLLREGETFRRYPPASAAGFARELHGKRWSVVAFSDSYVADGPATVLPPLGDAHHATPKVGFSHGTALTTVGTRRAISFQRGP